MPELPEVETIARTLAPQIVKKRIVAMHVLHPKVVQAGDSLLSGLEGAVITHVHRRAKLLLVDVASSAPAGLVHLVFHLKMTGSFFVHPHDTPPQRHTRLVIDLDNTERLFFNDVRTFGYCRIMPPDELLQWPFWRTLGPEPLEKDAPALAAHFTRVFALRRAAVKSLLLDQRIVAGVGNIYADEALFRARIHPQAAGASLAQAQLASLAESLQAILRQSIEECGSSIRDYRDALGNAGAFQNAFSVYGRKGENCVTCGAPLASARVAGRSTVFCPVCQAL